MLLPCSVAECYSMAIEAFDVAEQLQTPVFVMTDLDLGMNTWMSDAFPYPDAPINRGKVLDEAKLRQLGAQWGRYADVDGDGIPYRTVPGDGMPPYFARGSGHNAKGQYSERADDYGNNVDRLARKFETARTVVPQPEIQWNPKAKVGVVAYGTSHFSVEESRDQLRDERQIETSYYRLRAYPFALSLNEFIDRHDRVYVVEQNRDGQMAALMRMVMTPERIAKIRPVLQEMTRESVPEHVRRKPARRDPRFDAELLEA